MQDQGRGDHMAYARTNNNRRFAVNHTGTGFIESMVFGLMYMGQRGCFLWKCFYLRQVQMYFYFCNTTKQNFIS
jgi:hypothetical protein